MKADLEGNNRKFENNANTFAERNLLLFQSQYNGNTFLRENKTKYMV